MQEKKFEYCLATNIEKDSNVIVSRNIFEYKVIYLLLVYVVLDIQQVPLKTND